MLFVDCAPAGDFQERNVEDVTYVCELVYLRKSPGFWFLHLVARKLSLWYVFIWGVTYLNCHSRLCIFSPCVLQNATVLRNTQLWFFSCRRVSCLFSYDVCLLFRTLDFCLASSWSESQLVFSRNALTSPRSSFQVGCLPYGSVVVLIGRPGSVSFDIALDAGVVFRFPVLRQQL